MKIAFIADIHGNAIALEHVLNDIQKKSIDKIYVLGDLCYRGPEPKRSLDLVRSLNTEVIKGNADEWVVRGVQAGEVPDKALEKMNQEKDWTVTQLDQHDLRDLNQLPQEIRVIHEDTSFHMFHAVPNNLFEIVLPSTDDHEIESKLMSFSDADIYVYAHIHKPFVRSVNGKIILNTGSVGLPFDGIAKASYVTVEVENGNIHTCIHRVPYDVEHVVQQYESCGYPNAEMMIKVLRNAKIG
jgi:putative phosphoesterase